MSSMREPKPLIPVLYRTALLRPAFLAIAAVVLVLVLASIADLPKLRRHLITLPLPSAHPPTANIRLATHPVYMRHFIPPPPPPPNTSRHASFLPSLAALRIAAVSNQSRPAFRAHRRAPAFTPKKGISFFSELVPDGYTKLRTAHHPLLCLGNLSRSPQAATAPPMCLSALSNAYVGACGAAIVPDQSCVYEIAGGCCRQDWTRLVGKQVRLPRPSAAERRRVLLVLAHHHSVTYHHVLHEVLVRFLRLAVVVDAASELFIVIDRGEVAPALLARLGLPSSRVLQVVEGEWAFGAVVLYPPALHFDFQAYPPKSIVDVAAVISGVGNGRQEEEEGAGVDAGADLVTDDRKVMVLMERARGRGKDGQCGEQRCMRNFADVRAALERTFGEEYNLVVYGATDDLDRAIEIFSIASVVVGIHGAGFQNIMFCRPRTTIVHLGWDLWYADLGEMFNLSFHSVFVPNLERNTNNYLLSDIPALVRNVSEAIQGDGR